MIMKISKNSWHYKLNKLAKNEIIGNLHSNYFKPTLCRYFWATLLSIFVLLIKGISILFGLSCVALLAWVTLINTFMTLFSLLTGIGMDHAVHDLGFATIISFIFFITLGSFISFIRGDINFWPKWFPVGKWINKLRNKTNKVSETKPNLIVEYIKAKKAKVCPLVELEE